ncbi:hypothetical protein I4U23_008366 [Adineta vaga]|nr:hypothetical protein I4U23_008366 [Adineta vaga]
MGCCNRKIAVVPEPWVRQADNQPDDQYDESVVQKRITTETDDAIITKLLMKKNTFNSQLADPDAFNESFIQQRQQVIDNQSYRSTIETWKSTSLPELVNTIKAFSKDKSIIDRYWFIYYWTAINIEYDTVSYFTKNYADQTAEGVFRTRKGVCAGYANIYKHLCDQMQIPCEIVGGYSKGYGFDDREGAPAETDHAWNAVEIYNHWYLLDSTWGAGHLNDEKLFERRLDTYYFLTRPNEMIYHHLPKEEKWQLLETPIKMNQYMMMPKLRPPYFELNLELISPYNKAHVDLLPGKSYALVLIRIPTDIHLLADLKLNDKKIEGGHRLVLDKLKKVYCCYFAPANAGLEVISPQNTHLIKLTNGEGCAQILIKTPENIELHGMLKNDKGEKVENRHQVYYRRRKNIWQCNFAPNHDGVFQAEILAKKTSDSGHYSSAVSFKIDAKDIPTSTISYPRTWQEFYDLDLEIVAPLNRANAVWADDASYAEVLIKAPDDVQFSSIIKYNDVKIENGSLVQYYREKNLWQLLFAPERIGQHRLIVYGKRNNNNNNESDYTSVVEFNLNATTLQQSMKFPTIYTRFQTTKCHIYTPIDGILNSNSVVSINCIIPGAKEVTLKVDSKWLEKEGYTHPVLQRQITDGSKEVVIYAKYDEDTKYSGLVKYTVQ